MSKRQLLRPEQVFVKSVPDKLKEFEGKKAMIWMQDDHLYIGCSGPIIRTSEVMDLVVSRENSKEKFLFVTKSGSNYVFERQVSIGR